MGSTVIATWFVADEPGEETLFPQIGAVSNAAGAMAVYWRCTACFYASSLAVNPQAHHVLYTNTTLPNVDGIDLAELFARWGIEVVTVAITWRLSRGSVHQWGNQFYVFDAIRHFIQQGADDRLILLDSDCLWLESVAAIERAIDRHRALTYLLGDDEHAAGSPINGLSRAGMAQFLASHGGERVDEIPYFGGEIFAADRPTSARVVELAETLWPEVAGNVENAPREEAHLLSVIYALEDIAPGTANRFIRRMWTTFHHHNLHRSDADLAIWHLPAEKKTGFQELFREVTRHPQLHPTRDAQAMGLHPGNYARAMGFPRRRPAKFARDLSLKIVEKLTG